MDVTINGENTALPEGMTLRQCLEGRGLNPDVVVVERNRDIVPAERFGATRLEEGDVLEILHFVGGG